MPKKSVDPLLYPTLDDDASRDVDDHYSTPEWLVKTLTTHRNVSNWLQAKTALDLGSGNGIWGQYLRYSIRDVDGIDIRKVDNPVFQNPLNTHVSMHNNLVYRNLFSESDFMEHDFGDLKYDIIGFNPPFQLFSSRSTRNEFLNKLINISKPYGRVCFILPISYLYGLWRWDKLWSKGSLLAFYPFSDRIDWTNAGAPRKEHGLFIWQFSRTNPDIVSSEYMKFEGNIIKTRKE